MGFGDVPTSQDDDLMAAALRQHLPRSPLWSLLSKWQKLHQRADEEEKLLMQAIERLVKCDDKLRSLSNAGLSQITPGVVAVLALSAKQWSQGNPTHTLKDSLDRDPAGDGRVNIRIGFSQVGIIAGL